MELSRYRRAHQAAFALLLAVLAADATAQDGDESCLKAPVVSAEWRELSVPPEGIPLGEWVLPPSSDRPDLRTDVTLRAWIEHREGRTHEVVIELRYSSANELGIPYGLQKVEFSVLTRQGRVANSLDWTDRCTVGNLPSLLPGDTATFSLEVPGPAGKEALFFPQLRFWGSLN